MIQQENTLILRPKRTFPAKQWSAADVPEILASGDDAFHAQELDEMVGLR